MTAYHNKNDIISLCYNTFGAHYERDCTQTVIALLKDDLGVKRKIKKIREVISQKGKCEEVNKLKTSLPSFNMGIFKDTEKNTRNSSFLYTDKLLFDFDDVENITKTKEKLKNLPGAYLVFVSPSGKGIKAVFQLDRMIRDIDDYKQAYANFAWHLQENTGLTPDTTCDPRRLCFLSHDEELFFNPDASPCCIPIKPVCIPIKPACHVETTPCTKIECSDNEQNIIAIVSSIIRRSKPGNRHPARLKAGYSLGGYIGAGEIEEQRALNALTPIIQKNTDDFTKAIKTFKDATTEGKKKPRQFVEISKSCEDLLIPSHILGADLSLGAKLTYSLLIKYSEGGECRPKQKTISKSLGFSPRAVSNYLSELKQKNYIDVIPGNSFNEKANRYFFLK